MTDRLATNAAAGPRPPAAAAAEQLPADAVAVRAILRSMGAEEAEPGVLAMLLDFVYTHAAGVLQDAESYGEALGREPGSVELAEVGFAMAARVGGGAFAQPPPQDALERLADEVGLAGFCFWGEGAVCM
jgi:hypothetical protein